MRFSTCAPLLLASLLLSAGSSSAEDRPLSAAEEQAGFHLAEGFVAELLADESVMQKAVTFNFDNAGRMWVTTASEYPLDANEQPEKALVLYRSGGKDAVLVFDTPWAEGLQKPRVFAGMPPEEAREASSGKTLPNFPLAMPMGVLPYKDGAIVQHGPELLMLRDIDSDGAADTREVVLGGFGIQDSHLMPHGFTRGPGDWIYFAQGAFNTSHVQTKEGPVVEAKHCKVMRMQPDGSRFEVVGWGLNNIWGFVIDPRGEMWVQEANDMGYPVAPFQVGMAYPGIGDDKPKPYAPQMPPPGKLNDVAMGGTGLSGLALNEDPSTWPAPWTGAFMVANPITNKIQAVRVHREGPGYEGLKLEKLPDFLVSSDKRFRPVATQFGPDGSLYVIDWYNKIISHNEVPRAHPERDKTRSRIWRIRWKGAEKQEVVNLTKLTPEELIVRLNSANQWEANAARSELTAGTYTDQYQRLLADILADETKPLLQRLQCLWALEAQRAITETSLSAALASNGGALKHEAVRALVEVGMPGGPDAVITLFGSSSLWKPTDPIWVQLISTFQKGVADPNSSALLTMLIPPPKVDVLTKSPQARFQRAQLRASLEQQIDAARPYLADGTVSRFSGGVPLETRALLCLVVPPEEGAAALSRIAPDLERKLLPEEISLLAAELSQPTVRTAFEKILNDPTQRAGALAALEGVPAKAWTPELTSMVVGSMRDLLSHDPTEANRLLLLRLAAGRKLTELEPEIKTILQTKDRSAAESIAAIRALHEIGSADVDLLRPFFTSTNKELQREAITTLASGKSEQAVPIVVGLWPKLPVALRKLAIERLASSKAQGQALVAAVRAGRLPVEDLDGSAIEKLSAVLGDDTELTALLGEIKGALQPVLRLDGGPGDIVETGIDLVGPFTVEAWVKLDAGIGNEDTLLGSLAGPSLNFYDGRLRVFVGGEAHDVIVARTALKPETWTHVAVTRDSAGRFRIYLNGELDVEKESGFSATLTALHIGGNGVGKGTAGWFTEFRAWNVERTAEEIRDAQLQSFASEPLPPQLVRFATGAGPWGTMRGQARVQQVRDFPALLTGEDARLLNEKFAHFRALAEKPGDLVKGQMRFDFNCAVCHVVKGEGGKIGPDLSGAGAMGTESLLRNIITPHIQLESGYYRYDVELTNGDVLSGFLVKEADDAITLRPPGAEERVIPRAEIRKTSVSKRSLMPEGLLESMAPEHVSDLFTYLRSLK